MGRDLKTVHTSIKSNKKGKEEAIVSQVGYDKNGRTIYTRMFNGTENTNGCRACCHSQRRQHYANAILIRPRRQYSGHFQRYYTKDTEETERVRRSGSMDGLDADKEKMEKPLGGAFSHTYAYDELNRLIRAEGKAYGLGYAMDMSFGLMGEPLTKAQRTDSGSVAGSYALTYEYGDSDGLTIIGVEDTYQQTFTKNSKNINSKKY